MEWYPSSSEVIGWNVNVNQNDRSYHNLLENDESWDTGTSYATTACRTKRSNGQGWDVDGNYRKEFNNNPKHVLTAQIRHSRSDSRSDEFIEEGVRGSDSGPLALDTNIQFNSSIRTVAQLDFEKPLANEGKWEWGWKSNLSVKDDRFEYLASDTAIWQEGILVPVEPVAAAFSFTYRKTCTRCIPRGTEIRCLWRSGRTAAGAGVTEALWEGDQSFSNDYFSAYPSFNLSKQRNDEVSWIASYSRRVNRPRGRSVTPFIDDSDSRNIRTGNPSAPRIHQQHGDRTPVDAEPDVHHDLLVLEDHQRHHPAVFQHRRTRCELPDGSTKGSAKTKGWKSLPWPPYPDAARPG